MNKTSIENTLKSPKGKTDWAKLDAQSDAEILQNIADDPDAAPVLDAEFWQNARVVVPPKKRMVSLRLDEDMLAWFRIQGDRYQTKMNAILRSYMDAHSS